MILCLVDPEHNSGHVGLILNHREIDADELCLGAIRIAAQQLFYKSLNGSILARILILQIHPILGIPVGDADHTCHLAIRFHFLRKPKGFIRKHIIVIGCQLMRCLVGIFKNTSVAPYDAHRILIEGQLLIDNRLCIVLFLPDLVDGCQQLGFLAGGHCGCGGPDAKAGKPGALDLPDLFSAHPADASALGIETLVDWNDWFTAEDMAAYVPGFVQDGIIEGRQVVFPVSKSTQLIFLNGSQYARFAADTGAQLSTLATWDGFFEMAGAYRQWSQGKPFCALDYPLRLVELNALEQGGGELYKGSWYDLTNETFRASWMEFAKALVQGDILVSDLYSNTQVMTGETLAGLGSSAAILYYNDFVTYPDNTTEPTDLLLAPLPHAAGTTTPLMPQAGVGLCAFKTTDQKAEAAAVFLRWLTEQQRNLEFAADTGYMPVSSAAFDAIADYPFEQQSYQRLYDVYNEMRLQNTPLSEPGIVGYHAKAKTLYDSLRQRQKDYPQRLADGETLEDLAEETWQLLCDNA